ncbi:sulfite exporter TauE/SafE family protein [Streptomyces longispororuber]|uniref:sulfite exporter TauE/SafE family protein n=1 Tax=Streptomyces longispororuber TaxID=68230 RepID=UPI002108E318|nr:sulfite exporter TauE/SafE family protein [Streptomyces longispororuber]MCQ4207278.1 sulfite exporter TauE/SafE family protein [Streptomyces longispororuber]
MDFSWTIVVAGALVGLAVGLTGMGGGALMTPIMVMFFGVNPTAAIGSDLATSLFMKPFGAAVHHRAGTIRWDIVRWLLPTALPAAFAGALLLQALGDGAALQTRVKYVIGGALLLAVAGMLARMWLDRRRGLGAAAAEDAEVRVRPVATLLIGLVGGLVVGMTSVGSGSLIIVMLMLAHPRLRANHLVGTDLVQAVPLVGAAALGHFLVGDVSLGLTGTLLVGAIPGVLAGAVLSTRVSGPALRWALVVLLTGSGLAMWGVSGAPLVVVCGAVAAVGLAVTLRTRRTVAAPPAQEPEPSPTMTP